MDNILLVLIIVICLPSCEAQIEPIERQNVGGPCEGCEALHEYGIKKLGSIDTLPEFESSNSKLMIRGTVYQSDAKTPAKDVILYIYHTDQNGLYPTKGDETGWAQRHGYLRGWVKTSSNGKYAFYTFRPAAYPDVSEAEHIHLTVKEPLTNAYYLDNFVFDDDPLLTKAKVDAHEDRGGSGITSPRVEKGINTITRDIILGLHIPNYR